MPKLKKSRFVVEARRKGTNEGWTTWLITRDSQEAEKQRDYAASYGYETRIIGSDKEKSKRNKQETTHEQNKEINKTHRQRQSTNPH